jgi:ketosteroid isomerase-like protein
MQILLRAALCSLVLSLPAVGQTADKASSAPDAATLAPASQEQLDVAKVLLAQQDAWNRGDIEAFATGYKDSPETLFIGSSIRRGFADMLAGYRTKYPNRDAMGTLAFSDIEVRPISDTYALVIGKFHLERSKKGGGAANGVFSLLFQKTQDGWKIIVDHTSTL